MPAAKNIASARWISDGRIRGFQASRAYGVVDAAGRMLSIHGDHPSTWSTLAIAGTIAEYVPADAQWIDPA